MPSLHCLLFSYRNPYSKAINYSRLTPQKIFRTEREEIYLFIFYCRGSLRKVGRKASRWLKAFDTRNGLIRQQPTADRRGWFRAGWKPSTCNSPSVRFLPTTSWHYLLLTSKSIFFRAANNVVRHRNLKLSPLSKFCLLNANPFDKFYYPLKTFSFTDFYLYPEYRFNRFPNRCFLFHSIVGSFSFHCAEIFFYEKKNELLNFPQVNFSWKLRCSAKLS